MVSVFSWAEWVHWRSTGRRLGARTSKIGAVAIIVPGFKNRAARANYLNRYRVRAALRSMSGEATRNVLFLCGAAVRGSVAEAELMAQYARDELGYAGPIHLDRESTTTWENIQNLLPFLDEFDTIKIASNSLHAEKAREYLWRQRPALAERLAKANEYRIGEILLVKPVAAYLGLKGLRSLGAPTSPR